MRDNFQRDQSQYITSQLKHAPREFVPFIKNRFNYTLKKKGLRSANLEILHTSQRLKAASIKLAMSDDEICERAERYSRDCSKAIAGRGLEAGRCYAVAFGAKLVDPEKVSQAGEVARLSDAAWWRRQLRRKHGRAVEGEAVGLRMVHGRGQLYASNASLNRRRSQRRRNLRILEELVAVNEVGDSFTLAELAALSVSNPAIRRGELMTRIAGFELYAKHNNHVGEFWTITCPSRMHAMKYGNNKKWTFQNERYDETTPRQAQQYLAKVWSRARACLARHGIEIYGFRVAEPQHDGTPHWHLLLFMHPAHVEAARAIVERYALQTDGGEPGAKQYRFDKKSIDWSKGSAAGYIAKYISKNIDGFGVNRVDADLTGKRNPQECAERVDTWASTWGIRQFQQIGGHSVTVWRELRRLKEVDTQGTYFEHHRVAADLGNWCEFLEQMDKRPLSLSKEWSDEQGRYCEPKGWRINGVESSSGMEIFISRKHIWSIGNEKESDSGRSSGFCDNGGFDRGSMSGAGVSCAEGSTGRDSGSGEKQEGLFTGDSGSYIGRQESAVFLSGARSSWLERWTVDHGQKSQYIHNELMFLNTAPANDAHVDAYRSQVRFAFLSATGAPWSPVNNCTVENTGRPSQDRINELIPDQKHKKRVDRDSYH